MRNIKLLFFLLPIFILTSNLSQIPKTDEKQDPFKELIKCKESAKKENKKILIIVGGNWCDWCQIFDNFINFDEELSKIIKENFVVMKVYSDKDLKPNYLFLSKFPLPPAFPHIYILNSKGEVLESKKSEEFEIGKSYDKNKIKEFLLKYKKDK